MLRIQKSEAGPVTAGDVESTGGARIVEPGEIRAGDPFTLRVEVRNDSSGPVDRVHVLPFDRDRIRRVAVVGPLATDRRSPMGSWNAAGRNEDVVTVLDGVRAAKEIYPDIYVHAFDGDVRRLCAFLGTPEREARWVERAPRTFASPHQPSQHRVHAMRESMIRAEAPFTASRTVRTRRPRASCRSCP